MAKFYFTYGTDGQPFFGGWTEVEAPGRSRGCAHSAPITPIRPRA